LKRKSNENLTSKMQCYESKRTNKRNRRLRQSLYSVDNGSLALNRDKSEKATESTAASNKYSKKFILSDK